MDSELKKARDWYWWLWLSPLLTLPTLLAVVIFQPGYKIVCGGYGPCNWSWAEQLTLIIALLISSLWHLLLLVPATNKEAPYVRWHGRQGLALAGIRTAVPLTFVILFGVDWPLLLAMPLVMFIWFTGTLAGQYQASKGKCYLAQWTGRGEELAGYEKLKPKLVRRKATPRGPSEWVDIIRYSEDPKRRRQALKALEEKHMVEWF